MLAGRERVSTYVRNWINGFESYTEEPATVGSIIMWPTSTAPTGYLECDGSSLLRSEYAGLFAVISDDYGAADGDHFTIPDMRGRFVRGYAHGSANDPDRASRTDRGDTTDGDAVGTKQADAYYSHVHSWRETHVQYLLNEGAGQLYTAGNTGSYGGNETRPININVMFCIKT